MHVYTNKCFVTSNNHACVSTIYALVRGYTPLQIYIYEYIYVKIIILMWIKCKLFLVCACVYIFVYLKSNPLSVCRLLFVRVLMRWRPNTHAQPHMQINSVTYTHAHTYAHINTIFAMPTLSKQRQPKKHLLKNILQTKIKSIFSLLHCLLNIISKWWHLRAAWLAVIQSHKQLTVMHIKQNYICRCIFM